MKIFFWLLMISGSYYQFFAQITFQKNFGGSGEQAGCAVKQCFDGGYVVTGYSTLGSAGIVYLLRMNELGDTLWTRTFYDAPMGGFDVIQTSDSNFVVTGHRNYNNPQVHLTKIDSRGNKLWARYFGTSDWGQAVQQTFDGGFITAGGNLYKTDGEGIVTWSKTAVPSGGGQAMYVIQTADSGYAIAGMVPNNIYLIKTDAKGNNNWTKYFSGTLQNTSNNILQQTSDGGYILTGKSLGTVARTLLIKTDANGNTVWTKQLPGFYGTSVLQTSNSGYAVGGYSGLNDQMMLARTDSSGNVLWTKFYGDSQTELAKSLCRTTDGGYVLTGLTSSFSADFSADVFVVKTDSLGNVHTTGISEVKVPSKITLHPNPAVSASTVYANLGAENISVVVSNMLGRIIDVAMRRSEHSIELYCNSLPCGVYVVRFIHDNGSVESEKLIITR